MQLSSTMWNVVDIMAELDFKVDTKKITDYSLVFEKSVAKNTIILYSENNLWNMHSHWLVYDSTTWSGTLSIIWNIAWSYTSKIYKWEKFVKESIIDGTQSIIEWMNQNRHYRIEGSFSWAILNTVYLQHLTKDNLWVDIDQYTIITEICENNDKTLCWLNNWVVLNKQWSKVLMIDWSERNSMFVFFEQGWLEKYIEIIK